MSTSSFIILCAKRRNKTVSLSTNVVSLLSIFIFFDCGWRWLIAFMCTKDSNIYNIYVSHGNAILPFHLCKFFRPAVFMRIFALTSWWVAALLKPTCGTLGWRWKEAAALQNKKTWCGLGTGEELSSLQWLLKVCLKTRVCETNVSTLPCGAWLSWGLSNSSHFSGKRWKLFG